MPDNNPKPVVSVIIPAYNLGRFLGEALNSVQRQTFTEWECIIVDNGSADNTKRIAADFTANDKRFQYFFHENKGVSCARNFAIKNSSGEFILPLDADDKIGSGYLMDAVSVLKNNPSLKIVYCEAERFGRINGKWNIPEFSMENMLKENCIFCSAFFRRSDYNRTKGYNEQMVIGFEDWEFWLELLKSGGEVYKIPKTHFYYRIRKSSRNNVLNIEQQRLLRRQVFLNHKELYEKYLSMPDILFDWYLKKESLKAIESSKEFKIGKLLLAPVRKLMTMFKY